MGVFFLVLSPVLALLVSKVLYDLFSRKDVGPVATDQMYDSAYGRWCREMAVDGRMRAVDSPLALGVGETCFACGIAVALYQPSLPCWGEHNGVFFDTACGASVGRGWSLMQRMPGVTFQGRGTLCVTDRNILFDAVGSLHVIPLETIHTVAASCSELLVGSEGMDRPFVFQGVNGQQFRDTLHILLEAG